MLLNVSNHPLSEWTTEQVSQATKIYGEICDIPFSQVPPDCDEAEIIRIARDIVETCMNRIHEKNEPAAIHVMGEMTLNFTLVRLFQQKGLDCVASVTERKYKLNGSGYVFLGFRKYPKL